MIDLSELGKDGVTFSRMEKETEESAAFSRMNDATLHSWLPQWTRNAAENYRLVPEKPQCFSFLKNTRVGEEAAVLASGPSLDESIQYVKNFRGVVFAGNSTVNSCVANGRWPDWVVILDADEYVASQFDWFTEEEKRRFKVVLPTYVHPSVPKLFDPEKTWWFNPYNPIHWFFTGMLHHLFPSLAGLLSSSCNPGAMVRLAWLMGMRKVYLLGADFSFPGGRERCSVYDREGKGWVKADIDGYCQDASERSVVRGIETTSKLKFSMESVSSIARSLSGLETVDCSAGILEGFPKKNFKEVVDG